jgi:tripartite-type tricarboxylate transporter receptor subunit TctC
MGNTAAPCGDTTSWGGVVKNPLRNIVCLALLLAGASSSAQQPYPSRLVRIISPQAAGSGVDAMLRAVAGSFSERIGQPVIVENRPGANGIVALEACSKSSPDGHTLCNLTSSAYLNPFLYPKLPFDLQKDFAPISNLVMNPEMIAVHSALPVSNWADLVAYTKANPGKLNYSGYGPGSTPEMVFEWLRKYSGLNLTQVPYKNVVDGMRGFSSGESQVVLIGVSLLIPQLKAGNVKGLLVYRDQRLPEAPSVPTLAEAGAPDWHYHTWFGMAAPAGTPASIVDRAAAEFAAVMAVPAFRERIRNLGFEPATSSPEEYARFLAATLANAAVLVKTSGAKVE